MDVILDMTVVEELLAVPVLALLGQGDGRQPWRYHGE